MSHQVKVSASPSSSGTTLKMTEVRRACVSLQVKNTLTNKRSHFLTSKKWFKEHNNELLQELVLHIVLLSVFAQVLRSGDYLSKMCGLLCNRKELQMHRRRGFEFRVMLIM